MWWLAGINCFERNTPALVDSWHGVFQSISIFHLYGWRKEPKKPHLTRTCPKPVEKAVLTASSLPEQDELCRTKPVLHFDWICGSGGIRPSQALKLMQLLLQAAVNHLDQLHLPLQCAFRGISPITATWCLRGQTHSCRLELTCT